MTRLAFGTPMIRALRFAVLAAACLTVNLAQAADKTLVKLDTNLGAIVLELNAEKAPKSVANFLSYVDSGFYDNTIFHRVINGFVAQGGGYDPQMQGKPTRTPVANEAKNGLKNAAGTVALARTRDPDSATSQFFINLVDNNRLDYPSFDGWGYAVFGKVVDGMDTVRRIGMTKTGDRAGMQDVPVEPIIVKSAKRVSAAQAK